MGREATLVLVLLCSSPALAQDLKGFFGKHCLDCHDAESRKGNLDLSAESGDLSSRKAMDRWTSILDRVAAGEMPPAKKAKPSDGELKAFFGGMGPKLAAADRARREVVQRRLNRVEYEHAVRDLLAVDVDLKELLAEDQRAGGFDNNGEALAISAELLAGYLEAAERAIDAAIVHGPKPEEKSFTATSEKDVQNYLKSYSVIDGRVFIYQSEEGGYSKIATREKRIPVRGVYRISFEAVTRNTEKPIAFSVNASDFHPVHARSRTLGYFDATSAVKRFEFEALLEKQFALQFFAHELPGWVHNEPALGKFAGIGWGPVTFTGPLLAAWPPESHTRLLGDLDLAKGAIDDARAVLRRFMPRAFRRPVSDDEVGRMLAVVESRLALGRTFEQALRAGLAAVLCSPNFLTLREDVRPGERISDPEFAARLSFFLGSTSPDAELSAARLGERGVAAAQARRLLSDRKSDRFVEHFTDQWLLLRNIDATTPDRKLYKEFDELLKISMLRESRSFFREILDKDLPIASFLHSDFAMLNRRLAANYGVPGVESLEVARVALPAGSVRGGILTQGAVLKVTANGTSTSPVIRGLWVLENVLGKHVPPPPPGVPGIEPDIRGATTIREQLDKHRAMASCAQCHRHIDPPGFALESFDPIGRFRKHYVRWQGHPQNDDWGKVVDGAVVDPSGTTSAGKDFAGVAEFKALLLERKADFARCLTEKLMSYALGREMGYSDRPEIEGVVARAAAKGDGLRTLILEIVESPLFSRR